MLILFFLSLIFGFTHNIGLNNYIVGIILAAIVVVMIILIIESKQYPDLASIAEDVKENNLFPDKPYTCMLNPLIPSLGIWGSGTVIGYIDVIVWASFFGVVVLIGISYFLFVIPRRYDEKMKHIKARKGSLKNSQNA